VLRQWPRRGVSHCWRLRLWRLPAPDVPHWSGRLGEPSAPTSVETVEYYPYQVKGYQNSYPHRTIVILLPTDARDLNGPNAAPKDGQPAIGIVTDQSETVIQRLYSQPLPPDRTGSYRAFGRGSRLSLERRKSKRLPHRMRNEMRIYVLAAQITKWLVKKHRGLDGRFGPTWATWRISP